MDMNDMETLAKLVWNRKEQLLDRRIPELEQERYRFFFWIMNKMEDAVEREDPHRGRILRRFECIKKDQRRASVITTGSINNTFTCWPTVDADEFLQMVAETINFIETIEGFGTWNRFPKDSRNKIDEFLLVLEYKSSKIKKDGEKEKEENKE